MIHEQTTIDLRNDDAAIVFDADGGVEMYVPELPGDEEPPRHVEWAVALSCLMSNEEWVRRTWDRWLNFRDTVLTVPVREDRE